MTRGVWPILVALWAVAQGATLLTLGAESPLTGGMVDSDSYLRLLRVRDWLDGGWYDTRVARADWPAGMTSSWTRPLDLLIVALHAPFRLAGWMRDPALMAAGAAVSPLLHLALLLLLPWAFAPLLEDEARALLPLVVLAQPAVFTHSMVGRADHHGLIALAIVVTAAGVVRAMADPRCRARAWWAGVAAGLGLWVSTEFLLPIVVVHAALGVVWLRRGGGFAGAGWRIAAGMLAATVVALAVERAPSDWWSLEFDRFSVVHVAMAAIAVAAWGTLAGISPTTPARRLAAGAVAGALAVLAMGIAAPGFFGGPVSALDQRAIQLQDSGVTELQPLLEPGRLLAYLGPAVFALPYALWRARRDDAWSFVVLGLVLFLPLAVRHVRFADEAELLLAVPIAALAAAWSRDRPLLLRPIIVLGLTVGCLFAGLWLVARQPAARSASMGQSCPLAPIAAHLARFDRPATILVMPDSAPELLWRTSHQVVGVLNYRSTGFLDAHDALTTADAGVARRTMAARQVDLVMLCPSDSEAAFFDGGPHSLYRRLLNGDAPPWLVAEPLPPELDGFRLYRLNRDR